MADVDVAVTPEMLVLVTLLWHLDDERAKVGEPSLIEKLRTSLRNPKTMRYGSDVIDLAPIPEAPEAFRPIYEKALAILSVAKPAPT